MSSETSPLKFVVPASFGSSAPGDCYLESCEGDQFKAVSMILAVASPIFRDMFDLPQAPLGAPRPPSGTDLPVVQLSEDSSTLLAMLRLLYPPAEELETGGLELDLIPKLRRAHDKYDIPLSRLRTVVRGMFTRGAGHTLLSSHGLQMYAVAWSLDMGSEAKIASRYTHGADLLNTKVAGNLLQQSGSLDSLLALLELRKRREDALYGIIVSMGLRKVLCENHGGQAGMALEERYFVELEAIKKKALIALQVPYPGCHNVMSFLNLTRSQAPSHTVAGKSGYVPCSSGRKCFASHSDFSEALGLIQRFPVEVERSPLQEQIVSM